MAPVIIYGYGAAHAPEQKVVNSNWPYISLWAELQSVDVFLFLVRLLWQKTCQKANRQLEAQNNVLDWWCKAVCPLCSHCVFLGILEELELIHGKWQEDAASMPTKEKLYVSFGI